MKMEEHILQVAERLFLEKGFALTSTTEIAKEVGCNQALVYYYFRTKETLFMQVFLQKMQLFVAAFTEIANEKDDFYERLRHRIEAHASMMEKNPNLPFLIMNELILNKERRNLIRTLLVENSDNQTLYYQFDKELKQEIVNGNVKPIETLDLLLNIISLNVFIFVSAPIYTDVLERTEEEKETYIKHRREVAVSTILDSLRPTKR